MAQRRRRWRVRLSERAERDFAAIIQWTVEQFGRQQAAVYSQTLIDALSELSADPFVADSHARDEIQRGLRSLHIARHGRRGRHFVVYRTSGRGTIDILRVLHDSMDIARHVPDDPAPGGS